MGCPFGCPAVAGLRCGDEACPPFVSLAPPGDGEGANDVGAVFAACAAAWTASGATGAPPTCASIGEPPGRAAAANLRHRSLASLATCEGMSRIREALRTSQSLYTS